MSLIYYNQHQLKKSCLFSFTFGEVDEYRTFLESPETEYLVDIAANYLPSPCVTYVEQVPVVWTGR